MPYMCCLRGTSSICACAGTSPAASPSHPSDAPTVRPTQIPSKTSAVQAPSEPRTVPTTMPEQPTTPASASDYDVRLTSYPRGIVEIYLNKNWHPLCGKTFPSSHCPHGVCIENGGANSVCKRLGRGYIAGMAIKTSEKFSKDAFDPGVCGPGQWGLQNRCDKFRNHYSFTKDCKAGRAIGTTVQCFTSKTLEAARTVT